jgi:hypothetical protein
MATATLNGALESGLNAAAEAVKAMNSVKKEAPNKASATAMV